MRRSILLAISLLLQYLCVNYSLAQKLFFESTLYNDSIVIDDWVNNKYGLHVQKYEPQRLKAKNSAVDNTTGWQHLLHYSKPHLLTQLLHPFCVLLFDKILMEYSCRSIRMTNAANL